MTGPRCENDMRHRFTIRPGSDSHGSRRVSAEAAIIIYASAARPCVAGRAALAVVGATPQSEGLVRVRRQVCFHNLPPSPRGRSHTSNPLGGKATWRRCEAADGGSGGASGSRPAGQIGCPVSMAPCQRSNRSGH